MKNRLLFLSVVLILGLALSAGALSVASAMSMETAPGALTNDQPIKIEKEWTGPAIYSPTGLVAGMVYDPDYNLVPGSEVSFYTRDWEFVNSTLSDVEGYYSLMLSDVITRYYGIAWPPAGSPYTYTSWYEIELWGEGDTYVDFWLRRPDLAGYVRDQFGNPVVDATINVYNADYTRGAWEHTDVNGHFIVAESLLFTEPYTVEVSGPWNMGYVDPEPIIVIPPQLNLQFELYQPPVSAFGNVFFPDGTPAQDASISFGGINYWNNTFAWQDGSFVMRGLPDGRLDVVADPPWPITGFLHSTPFVITYTNGSEPLNLGNLILRYARKTLRGRFTDAATGAPVANAHVYAERLDAGDTAFAEADAQGYYTMTVEGGSWQLHIGSNEGPPAWGYSAPIPPVVFDLPPDQYEEKTANFAVTMATAAVKGRILCPDGVDCAGYGNPLMWVEFWQEGFQTGTELNGIYTFSLPLLPGRYEGGIWVDNNRLYPPTLAPFYVVAGQTLDLGDIVLRARAATITGRVTDNSGAPLSGIYVNSWSQDETIPGDWTETNAQGYYTLTATGGIWFVGPGAGEDMPYLYLGNTSTVPLTPTQTASGVNFIMTFADAAFDGRVVDSITQIPLNQVNGWVWSEKYSGQDLSYMDSSGLNAGRFHLRAQGGSTYRINVYPEPGSGYLPHSQDEALGVGESKSITIPLQATNSVIRGNFVNAVTSDTVAGLWLGWFSASRADGQWADVHINVENGSYEVAVTEGVWTLYLSLETSDYIVRNPVAVLTMTSGQVIEQDVKLWPTNSQVYGTLLTPNGDPAAGAFISAWGYSDQAGYVDTWAEVNENGQYTLTMLSGVYNFYASLPWEEMEARKWVAGYVENFTVTPGASVELTGLELRALDGLISGVVSFAPDYQDIEPVGQAYIWAWSENGQWTEGLFDFEQDKDGIWRAPYSLEVLDGDIWHFGAIFEDWTEGVYYYSEETVADLTAVSHIQQDLTLSGFYFLIEPLVIGFDASQPQFISLPNGVSLDIPAGTIVETGWVTLFLVPTAQLKESGLSSAVSLGYNIWVIDENGREISEFRGNVRVTLPYDSDDRLSERGILEDGLVPAYFSTFLGRWVTLESFIQDQAANTLTFLTPHFSKFRIGTNAAATPPTTPLKKLMLPLVRR